MKLLALIVALLSLTSAFAEAQSPFAAIQQSHIEGNVPPQSQFNSFLQRDLLAYFKGTGSPNATTVELQLLRDGPTQSGVSYPKYYMWVRILAGPKLVQEGAVRVAAIDQTHFEVTSFMSSVNIRSKPSDVSSIFPAALVPAVLSKAGAQ